MPYQRRPSSSFSCASLQNFAAVVGILTLSDSALLFNLGGSFAATHRLRRYFCFWGTYPCGESDIGTRGGNFASQFEKGGGVQYETMAGDVARAARWARDNAARLGELSWNAQVSPSDISY